MVLSFSFMGISEGLPNTGYIMMIDIWTIFALSYPFSVIALYSALEVRYISKKANVLHSNQF